MGNTIKQISSIRHKVSDTEIEQIILGAHAGIYTNYGILLSHNTEFPASSITENPKPSPYLGFIAACEHGSIKGNYQTVLGQYNVKRTEEHILQVGNGTNENNRKDALIAGKHGVCVSELRVGKYASGTDSYNGEPTHTDIHPPTNGNILPAYQSSVSTILGSQSILGHLATYGDIVSYGKISFRTWAGDENHDYYNTCYLQMMHGATSSSSGTYGMVPAPSASAEPLFLNNRGEWSKPASATLPELIGSSIGSNNKPIYWNGSSFQTIGYTIDKSVPSNAQFTDTIYTLPIATNTTLGGVKVPGNGVVIEAGGSLAASLNSVTKNSNIVDLPFEIQTGPMSEEYIQTFTNCTMSSSNGNISYRIETSINNALLSSMAQAKKIDIDVKLSNTDNISSATGANTNGSIFFWGTKYTLISGGGGTNGSFSGTLTSTTGTGDPSAIIISLPSYKTFSNFTTTATITITTTGVSRTVFKISIVDSIPRVQVIDSNGNLKTL